ncbi:type 1 glutamine amidotransferase [Oscillibacter valericigenes]|uniref:gamma-glutamyl-gamma-aminobutyrate hydrolase family protein n=1 Tax=Oscillibacter valericigenes TaxID=351091 RepID=UPI001F2B719B|nr:type 1 glutamine amidotransferase [Oscillibacter valericigenes]MCF2617487.1 type 1 glutamine amidotransferase [Oscillibacter valericigenes]
MATVYIWGEATRYENYRRAVEAAGGTVRFGGTPEGCDALLLPGGGDMEPWRYGQSNTASRGLEPERDTAELMLLERFTAAGKPVLGICRGIQVINVFFGGTLCQDLPGHSAVDGHDSFHTVRTARSPLLAVCGPLCRVNSAHHQAADAPGRGLRAVQWAEDGAVEAVCHDCLPVWGVQWHPERLPGELGGRLLRAFLALCF